MKLLLVSDMAQTGFGRVGRELATRLLAMGWDVRIIGINWRGIDGEISAVIGKGTIDQQAGRIEATIATMRADPLIDRIMPAGAAGDGMGHNLTSPAIDGRLWAGWKPDAAIVVADPRAMWIRLITDEGAIGRSGIPVLNYVPIEGGGLPADWKLIWEHVTPVAMSAFGQAQLETLTGKPVALAHHGVSDAFRPLSPADPGIFRGKPVTSRDGAKEAIGYRGRRIILRTDRFITRKNYPAWFRVLRPILATRPDLIALAHTVPLDDQGQGNIWQLISREAGARTIGIGQSGDAIWEHPQFRLTGWHNSYTGLTDDELRVLYCAADLLVSPTMAEGFGLTLAEAMGCGVPVVATDYSAVSEVVGPGGVLVPIERLFTNPYAHEWALVDEPAMTRAVEALIDKPARRRSLGEAGRRHVGQFTWAATAAIFDGLLRGRAAVAA